MSGPLRQTIGPTKARLIRYLNDLTTLTDALPEDESEREKVIKGLRTKARRIRGALHQLELFNQQWITLIASLPASLVPAEEKIYEAAATSKDGFLAVSEEAREALDLIADIIEESDDEDEDDDSPPEATTTTISAQLGDSSRTQVPSTLPTTRTPARSPPSTSEVFLPSLPKITIKPFDGDVRKWPEFWQLFSATVDKQNIPPVLKINYLLNYVTGAALSTIAGISPVAENYDIAVELLTERYGNSTVILRALHADLRRIPIATSDNTSLRRTYEEIERICRQLAQQGEDVDHPQVEAIIEQKWPDVILRELLRRKQKTDLWSATKLRRELNSIITLEEDVSRIHAELRADSRANLSTSHLEPAFTDRHEVAFPDHPDPHSVRDSTVLTHTSRTTSFDCSYCQLPHRSFQCQAFATPEARQQRAEELHLCTNCLRSDHGAHLCPSPLNCRFCVQRHHSSMCSHSTLFPASQRPPFPTIPTPPTSHNSHSADYRHNQECRPVFQPHSAQRGLHAPRSNDAGSLRHNPEVNSAARSNAATFSCQSAPTLSSASVNPPASPAQATIMMTIPVRLFNPAEPDKTINTTAILDSGSSQTWISSTLAQKLQLHPTDKDQLALKTFAQRDAAITDSHRFQIGFQTSETNDNQVIFANELPYMTGKIEIPPLTIEDIDFLREQKCEHLASQPATVEPGILIGIDYFWHLLRIERTLETPNGFNLLFTSLGPLITGRECKRKKNRLKTPLPDLTAVINEQKTPTKSFHSEKLLCRDSNDDMFDDLNLCPNRLRAILHHLSPELAEHYDEIKRHRADEAIFSAVAETNLRTSDRANDQPLGLSKEPGIQASGSDDAASAHGFQRGLCLPPPPFGGHLAMLSESASNLAIKVMTPTPIQTSSASSFNRSQFTKHDRWKLKLTRLK